MTIETSRVIARRDPLLSARLIDVAPLPGVRAGSGLAWDGDSLLVVQDDAFAVASIAPASREVSGWLLSGDGEGLPKALKPDFEAVFRDAGGRLHLVGSGSAPSRRWWAELDLASRTVVMRQPNALYEAIERAIARVPNLEGSVLVGERLFLFHRAAGGAQDTANLVIEVPFDRTSGPCAEVRGVVAYDLGSAASVALTFTDAAATPDGRLLYLAVAEDTPNAVDDGPIVGAAVGIIEGDSARWAPLLEADGSVGTRKVEGLALDASGRMAYVVTDADDPAQPAELARLVLDGPW